MNTRFALAALALGGQPAPAPAALHCPAPTAARGDVKAGPPLTHAFDLTHRGPAGVITVTRVEAGCGCLRQALSAAVLRPGETARLTLEVNTLTQPDGPNRWQARVEYRLDVTPPTGGPTLSQTGELLLVVTATLSREVSVTPPQVGFSCTGEATQTLQVADRRAKPLTVLRVTTSSPDLVAEPNPPVVAPGGQRVQQVGLRLTAAAPPGQRDETVVLLTDDPAYPEFRVPVRVLKRAPGGVTVAPESVDVRFAAGQTEVSALVQIRSPEGKPVAVAGAQSDNPAVAVKWSPESGPLATVRVTVTGSDAARPGGCVVRVKLAEPAGQEVVVPVSWTVGKREK